MEISPTTRENLALLDKTLEKCRTVLIVIHDYPDPDALAAATAFSHLMHSRYKIRTKIAYGGLITRAENRAMVQQLQLKISPASEIRWKRYRCVALLDTQPKFTNHALPQQIRPTVVIDHHLARQPIAADFADIRTGYGACATMLLEYLLAAEVDIPVNVATAIAYAIRTETQDFGRDTAHVDIQAYLQVYPKANKRKLAKITNPKLPHQYFLILNTTLAKARAFRHVAHVHLGEVESPEFISQIADLLLRHARISWALATGRYKDYLFISIRASHPNANAARALSRTLRHLGTGGGHASMAGGRIHFPDQQESAWQQLEQTVINRFMKSLGLKANSAWKMLLEK
ncbi:MAG: phosphoesterase [Calditrichaeota bacterium]|nr:MAG: phosphoesterase [Calditrichota bacterium]